jgi:hypothetical protein
MEIKKIINSGQGKLVMSIILGLGLATLFKRVCKGKNCVVFEKAASADIDDKVFKYDDKCYKFKMENTRCGAGKKSVKIAS